jgi:hypothetical protein
MELFHIHIDFYIQNKIEVITELSNLTMTVIDAQDGLAVPAPNVQPLCYC